ncbi:MAG: exo-alpha-sialidase [Planctomycetes bacterium]|nr:exo-alpha-sialidase [Planctomycetota bacterium]
MSKSETNPKSEMENDGNGGCLLMLGCRCIVLVGLLCCPVAADDLPEPIRVFVAGAEDIEGVLDAAQKYPQYREQDVVVTGDLNCRQYVVTSDDQGASWSPPREISDMVQTHGAVMVVGSGEGIQLDRGPHRGRLIVAGGDFYRGKKVLSFFSDDHGRTWRRSRVVPHEGKMAWASESKVAELADGSLIAVAHPKGMGGSILLCSVPVGPARTHGTVHASLDGGRTWPIRRLVVPGAFAYSSLVALPDGKIGLFYEAEGYREIRLVRFSLDWLLDSPPQATR